MDVLDFYCDESCCTGGIRYLAIGGIAVKRSLVPQLEEQLAGVRARYGGNKEMKWSKISRAYLEFYKAYVDVFFEAAAQQQAEFTSLYVDSHSFDHSRFNDGRADVGFNKLIYQLLLHKVGKPYGPSHRIVVMLDERSSKDDPNELTSMLNQHLRRVGIPTFPFRRVEFRDSKKCELIQLNDLLVGTVGFTRNQRADASPHKAAFAAHVMGRVRSRCGPYAPESLRARGFKVWPFKYSRGASPRA